MASTYVNDLRLNEMATGDESGNWGVVTNTNLELIGEALGYGTEGITTNANTHTTTVADGAADPGRAMYLEYTGTLDSACTITIAPNTVSRMHFIENGTSGSQNIIIKQGSGATITIPPGDTKAVYLDGAGSGAAVVDAFASLNVVDLKVQDDLTVTDDVIIGGDIDLEGSIDVNGTANLDIVDIDGAVNIAAAVTMASTNKILFNDASQFIQGSSATVLSIAATDEIDLTATAIDVNGTLDVSGQATFADGSAGAPSISNTGDVNAGLFFSAADVMSFSAGGTAQFTMADGSISPVTDNDIDLGTASLKYKSFFAGLVDSENFKINGGQGDDGQVLTSTGSGVAWEAASGGATDINGLSDAKTFGTSSIMLGDATTGTIDAANYNTALGIDVFAALTTGDNNTAVGFKSLTGNTTGAGNTAFGKGSAYRLTTGNDNTFLGHTDDSNAGATTSSSNTFVGRSTGERNTSGNSNTAVGALCMDLQTTGNTNTGVGSSCLTAMTTPANNTAVGAGAGTAITTGASNTILGSAALGTATTTSNTVAIGFEALKVATGAENCAVGYQAGIAVTTGADNVLMGYQAGDAVTTGNDNVAIGGFSMNTGTGVTGYANTTVGASSMSKMTTGHSNCGLGRGNLFDNTTGILNTAVGSIALTNNTTACCNTAVGAETLNTNTTGANNTAVGTSALTASTTVSGNTGVGYQAGTAITTGGGTTAVGSEAGELITTGNFNTVIGVVAGSNISTGDRNICIGYDSGTSGSPSHITTGDNGIVLGNNATTSAHIKVDWTVTSDKRDKTDIEPLTMGLNFVNELKPVTYRWDMRSDYSKDFSITPDGTHKQPKLLGGLLAQDVEKVEREYGYKVEDETSILTDKHDTNGNYGLTYSKFIPVLINAVKELSTQVDELKSELLALKGE